MLAVTKQVVPGNFGRLLPLIEWKALSSFRTVRNTGLDVVAACSSRFGQSTGKG